MVTLWWENKTRGRDTRGGNPSMYRKELSTALFHRANFFIRSWFILRQHCSSRQQERFWPTKTLRANKFVRSGKRFSHTSFQAHQAVTTDSNLDIQHSSFNSVMKGEIPSVPLWLQCHQPVYMNMFYDWGWLQYITLKL
jgi:hypothetical protein